MTSYSELLRDGMKQLSAAGLADERRDAKMLLLSAAGMTTGEFILREQDEADSGIAERFKAMLQRRCNREPVSLILGQVSFHGHVFATDARALAPRDDSEILVERALDLASDLEGGLVVDLGTGSGCLILSFLAARPGWSGIGLDKSSDALSLARENAECLGLSERVDWLEGGWTAASDALKQADLVLSNPPYIPTSDIAGLSPEVRNHDPLLALDGGEDGLDCYRDILSLLADVMKPGARLVFEIGYDQAEALKTLISGYGFADFAVYKDFSGHNRVVEAVKP